MAFLGSLHHHLITTVVLKQTHQAGMGLEFAVLSCVSAVKLVTAVCTSELHWCTSIGLILLWEAVV